MERIEKEKPCQLLKLIKNNPKNSPKLTEFFNHTSFCKLLDFGRSNGINIKMLSKTNFTVNCIRHIIETNTDVIKYKIILKYHTS